jgi:hypothetical protein
LVSKFFEGTNKQANRDREKITKVNTLYKEKVKTADAVILPLTQRLVTPCDSSIDALNFAPRVVASRQTVSYVRLRQ